MGSGDVMTLPEIISEASDLLAVATPGPWEISYLQVLAGIKAPASKSFPVQVGSIALKENAEFIAFARNNLPEILDELERRGKVIAIYEKYIDTRMAEIGDGLKRLLSVETVEVP